MDKFVSQQYPQPFRKEGDEGGAGEFYGGKMRFSLGLTGAAKDQVPD